VKICHDGMRCGNWPIKGIVELHPGKDGVVRFVTIRSYHGYYKRLVVKVAKIVLNDGFVKGKGYLKAKECSLIII
jgi:hypothetical protein